MSELFEKNLKYDLCSQTDLSLHCINTIVNVLKSLEYFAGKVWNIVPFEISNAACLEEFSTKIKVENLANMSLQAGFDLQ